MEYLHEITGMGRGEETNITTTNETQQDQDFNITQQYQDFNLVITEGWNPFLFAIYWAALNLLPNLIGVSIMLHR